MYYILSYLVAYRELISLELGEVAVIIRVSLGTLRTWNENYLQWYLISHTSRGTADALNRPENMQALDQRLT